MLNIGDCVGQIEIKAKRQNAALENMSDEDLDKALAELSE